jgi:hypothetical protein
MGKSGGLAEAPASEVRATLVSTCRLTGAIPQASEQSRGERASASNTQVTQATRSASNTHDTTSGASITCDTKIKK